MPAVAKSQFESPTQAVLAVSQRFTLPRFYLGLRVFISSAYNFDDKPAWPSF